MEPKNTITTVSDLEATYPDLVNQIRTSAAENERTRIKSIMDNAPAGYEDIVEDAAFKNPVDAGTAAGKILSAIKAAGSKYQAGAEKDASDSHMDDVEDGGSQVGGENDGKSVYDRAIEEVL